MLGCFGVEFIFRQGSGRSPNFFFCETLLVTRTYFLQLDSVRIIIICEFFHNFVCP